MKVQRLISIVCFTLLFKEYNCVRGGSNVTPGSIPYQVAIFHSNKFKCSGSLISKDWVLTAASCLRSKNISVILGETNMHEASRKKLAIPVDITISHPRAVGHKNNIGLIKLPSPAPLSKYIKPVALANNTGNYNGASAIISGWGNTRLLFRSSTAELKKVTVNVISNKGCERRLPFSYVRKNHICTKSNIIGAKGACSGDEGAPLVLSGKLVQIGIVTEPLFLCGGILPTMFVRVSKFKNWIENQTGFTSKGGTFDKKEPKGEIADEGNSEKEDGENDKEEDDKKDIEALKEDDKESTENEGEEEGENTEKEGDKESTENEEGSIEGEEEGENTEKEEGEQPAGETVEVENSEPSE